MSELFMGDIGAFNKALEDNTPYNHEFYTKNKACLLNFVSYYESCKSSDQPDDISEDELLSLIETGIEYALDPNCTATGKRAILEKIRPYLRKRESGWQPMHTAPKDKEQTCIIAWAETRDGGCPHLHGCHMVFWDDIENAWLIASSMRRIENDAWHLTAWQPCPDKPTTEIEDREGV